MPIGSDVSLFALWLLGLLLEGAFGCLAAFLLDNFTDLQPAVTGLAAGLSAPTILRQRFAQVDGIPLGVAYFYERTRKLVDRTLDRRARRAYVRWLSAVKETLFEHNKLTELGARLNEYLASDQEDPSARLP